MKLRVAYFKVNEIEKTISFYENMFSIPVTKKGSGWAEIQLENARLAFLKNDFNDQFSGSGCVPVIELKSKDAVLEIYSKAKSLGAQLVYDGVADGSTNSIVVRDPGGHELELTFLHD
jgi:predicted lactoylglutathione lyase